LTTSQLQLGKDRTAEDRMNSTALPFIDSMHD
jgi:hypothetical protein